MKGLGGLGVGAGGIWSCGKTQVEVGSKEVDPLGERRTDTLKCPRDGLLRDWPLAGREGGPGESLFL